MPAPKKDKSKQGPRSFQVEAPPRIEGPKRQAMIAKIKKNIDKAKEEELARLKHKQEAEADEVMTAGYHIGCFYIYPKHLPVR